MQRIEKKKKKEKKKSEAHANAFTNERADVSSSVRPAGGACLM